MTCNDCIHYVVCHRIINGIPITWADKCGDFIKYEEQKPSETMHGSSYGGVSWGGTDKSNLEKIREDWQQRTTIYMTSLLL